MTPDEAKGAVADQARVVARDGQGGVYSAGKVIAYSNVPVLTIETPGGARFTWRHDMCEVVELPEECGHCRNLPPRGHTCPRCGKRA